MSYKSWIAVVVILAVIIIGGIIYANKVEAPSEPVESGKVSGRPTDFLQTGKLFFTQDGGQADVLQFAFSDASVRGTTTLNLDELSVCAADNGSEPCIALNVPLKVPLDGKNAVVEGIKQGDRVLVRKIMTIEPDGHAHFGEIGDVFVSWEQVRGFIEACGPKMIMQTHALDVYMTFADGSRLRAVEPVIDEVMKVAESVREKCGIIPIATE